MPNITINLDSLEIFEKTAGKFGTGAHVSISKKYLGKNIKIITGKSKIIKNKLIIDFSKSEIFERKVNKFGTGAHIITPKEYVDQEIKILIAVKENE